MNDKDAEKHQDNDQETLSQARLPEADTSLNTVSLRALRDEQPLKQMGNYRLIRVLGKGGFGVVYEAEHESQKNRVALKTLPSFDAPVDPAGTGSGSTLVQESGSRLYDFKREFRSLAQVNHPNLVGMHSLEVADGLWFFTMDLVDGITFTSYVRPDGQLDLQRLRQALRQLVQSIAALHERGIVHRDLKPSNVMVDKQGNVKVLDFGLVMEAVRDVSLLTQNQGFAGTPAYASPEQCAGTSPGPASDWYSLGVMLYEALVGYRPIDDKNVIALIDRKRQEDVPELNDPSLPKDLVDLCHGLLQRDPDNRPDSAAIATSCAAKQIDGVIPQIVTESEVLFGRERQTEQLQSAVNSVDEEVVSVFVSGESGEGKTCLIESILGPIRRSRSMTVLSGRCYDRESVPFKALDSLIDAICSYLRSLPGEDAALLMPDDISFLSHLFPTMQRVDVIAKLPQARVASLGDAQVRARAFSALRLLLDRMSARRPVIMFIDDLQWGDADSAEAMVQVLQPPESPRVLFLGSFRIDERDDSPFLQAWEDHKQRSGSNVDEQHIDVGPLTEQECIDLAINQLGLDNQQVRQHASTLWVETAGNPFLLASLISCLQVEGDTFKVLPLQEVIEQRLTRLPKDAREILKIIAISGQALSPDEASRAAGYDTTALGTMTHMRSENLIRFLGADEDPKVDTYHDKIRESVLRELSQEKTQQAHQSLAQLIEQREVANSIRSLIDADALTVEESLDPIPRVFDLAYHYDAAGNRRRAWQYALLAAKQARSQLALEVAGEQFQITERNLSKSQEETRRFVLEGIGEAMLLVGRFDEAEYALDRADELAKDNLTQATIASLRTRMEFRRGAMEPSYRSAEEGLRLMGLNAPRSGLECVSKIGWQCIVQAKHSLLPFRNHRKTSTNDFELKTQLLNDIFHPTVFQSTPKMLWAHVASMNLAERYPPTLSLAHAYAVHGMTMSMLGLLKRGQKYSSKGMQIAEECDDLAMQGFTHCYLGIGAYAGGRFRESAAACGSAIEMLAMSGEVFSHHLARFHRACSLYHLGELSSAVQEARLCFDLSKRVSSSRTMCSSLIWARATQGDIPFEDLSPYCPHRPDDVMSFLNGRLGECLWHTFRGRTKEALKNAETAVTMLKNSQCLNSHTILALPMYAAAARRHAVAIESQDPAESNTLLKKALRVGKWGVRLSMIIPSVYPVALRELAEVYNQLGRHAKALKLAKKSQYKAEKIGSRTELTRSKLLRGHIAHKLGKSEATTFIEEAEQELATFQEQIDDIKRDL